MLALIPLIIIALLALSILILVHEFGHFLAAKISGVWVEEFGIGLPPRLWGKKRGDTIYSINLLPFGGFVRLHGESGDDQISAPQKAFLNKSSSTRIFIAIAGIIMNFLLAILCFTIIYNFTGIPRGIQIIEVLPDSPAEAAGILPKDEILAIDDKPIKQYDAFPEIISQKIGQEIIIEVAREEKGEPITKNLKVIVRSEIPENEGPIGIIFTPLEIYYPPLLQRPFVFTYYGTLKTYDYSLKIAQGIGMIFQELLGGEVPKGVAGPVGITAIVAEIAKIGILPLIEFIGIISINLALLNLIPFPPLDGSRVLFIALENIFGQKIKLENTIHTIGMAVLLLLLLALTANEIPRLISAKSLTGFVDTLFQ